MPEHIQYQDDDLFNPETHHEESDVPIKPLFWAIGIFIVFAIVTHLALGAMFRGFVNSEKKKMDPPWTQVALPKDAYVPRNQPLLQPFPLQQNPIKDTPVTDLAEMREIEDRRLHGYGWVDRQKGAVHIPIELAKQLVVQRGAAGFSPPSSPGGLKPAAPPGGTQ
ncbi:MAG TPA: hypothetical protein VKB93_22100 [Thermoanaerobaculia bacterium]|nr:hypothetical protein [Thermoanaerobaculia bacterium]